MTIPQRMTDERWQEAHQVLFATNPPVDFEAYNRTLTAAQDVFREAARLRAGEAMPNYRETVVVQAIEQAVQERDAAYHERAKLVAFLATAYGDQTLLAETSDCPGYGLVVIQSEHVGQMSWHIAERDFHLFPGVVRRAPEPPKWDGHSTEEKYNRLWALGMFEAGCRWFDQEQNPEAHLAHTASDNGGRPY